MNRRSFVKLGFTGVVGMLIPKQLFAFSLAKPKVTLRKSADRGFADHGWLKTKHSFSFANYQDPAHMGFQNLRVINQDIVQPLEGFPTHPHRDMEIVTYVLSGEVKHKDTLGNTAFIKRGEIQRMSAGTGIKHSEYNSSSLQDVHFLQIWIEPSRLAIHPIYEQKAIDGFGKEGLICVASERGKHGGLALNAEAEIYRGIFKKASSLKHNVNRSGNVWVQVVSGAITVAGKKAESGDGLKIENARDLKMDVEANTEFLLFELA